MPMKVHLDCQFDCLEDPPTRSPEGRDSVRVCVRRVGREREPLPEWSQYFRFQSQVGTAEASITMDRLTAWFSASLVHWQPLLNYVARSPSVDLINLAVILPALFPRALAFNLWVSTP